MIRRKWCCSNLDEFFCHNDNADHDQTGAYKDSDKANLREFTYCPFCGKLLTFHEMISNRTTLKGFFWKSIEKQITIMFHFENRKLIACEFTEGQRKIKLPYIDEIGGFLCFFVNTPETNWQNPPKEFVQVEEKFFWEDNFYKEVKAYCILSSGLYDIGIMRDA